MRKSLACDLMESMRPIIDLKVRKAINLGQCKKDDFKVYQNQYCLDYKVSSVYIEYLMSELLEYKCEIFIYIQSYYRSFMKGKDGNQFTMFEMR